VWQPNLVLHHPHNGLHAACRNYAAATAAVQAAASAGQPPQLQSLLVEPSWSRVLGPQFEQPYMKQLQGFLEQEWSSQAVYPPQQSIFRALNTVPFDQVGLDAVQCVHTC